MVFRRLIFSLIFIFATTLLQAQLIKIDSETGEFRYEEVVQAEGLTKDQLVKRAEDWIYAYYKEPHIKKDSLNAVGNLGVYQFSWRFISKNIPLTLIYDLEIKTKDGRYKYDFSNFRVGRVVQGTVDASPLNTYMARFPEKYLIDLEEPIDKEITKAIGSLQNFIITQEMIKEDDDW